MSEAVIIFTIFIVFIIILYITFNGIEIFLPSHTEVPKLKFKNKGCNTYTSPSSSRLHSRHDTSDTNSPEREKLMALIKKERPDGEALDVAVSPNILNVNNGLNSLILNYYMKQHDTNILISPFSLLSCFTLLLPLLSDNSIELKQIVTLFKITNPSRFINDLIACRAHLNRCIETYNTFVVNNDFIIKDSYKDRLKLIGDYKSFDPDKAADIIVDLNSTVKIKTHEMIPRIVDENDITPDTDMVLLNTIYFKGTWQHKFDKTATTKKTFHGLKDERQVDMMILNDKSFNYFEDDDKQVICLEYKYNDISNLFDEERYDRTLRTIGTHISTHTSTHTSTPIGKSTRISSCMSMVIVLPKSNKDMYDVNYDTKDVLSKLYSSSSKNKKVDIELPKFECATTLDLVPFFKNNDVTKIFEGIDINHALVKERILPSQISKIIQKTKIIVDEQGTEAAAVTMCTIKINCMNIRNTEKYKFIADHPFKYYIVYDKSLILFSGAFI